MKKVQGEGAQKEKFHTTVTNQNLCLIEEFISLRRVAVIMGNGVEQRKDDSKCFYSLMQVTSMNN